MDGIFYVTEFFFIILGFSLYCLVNSGTLEKLKAFIVLFILLLSNFFYYLVHSELIFKIADTTPENPSDPGYYFIRLYGHMLWLLSLFLALQGIVGGFWLLIIIDYAGLLFIENIAASYCAAWYATFMVLFPTALLGFTSLDYTAHIFHEDGNESNDIGMVLCMLFYLWPFLTLLFLVYHLIFSTWWALNVSIGFAISWYILNYPAICIETWSFFPYQTAKFERKLATIIRNIKKWKKNSFIQLVFLCFSIWASYSLITYILHKISEKIFEIAR
ncbi:unnamed protein product [Blepharisma stoltei]|uniref:Uncharacterized protein n=1 Tax=Blepharisma stoltei TaxID=1481888 RepID=A0AAU9JV19_9CILI|nr:unnamed protein product [Blepharisma stoltei]